MSGVPSLPSPKGNHPARPATPTPRRVPGAPRHCDFPACPEAALVGTPMCTVHAHVKVLGSYVEDRHCGPINESGDVA